MKNFYFFFLLFFFNKSNAQYTAIPDVNFEQELINQFIDTNPIIDGQILTSAINTRVSLEMNSLTAANIINLTGIEGFTLLEDLTFASANSLQFINTSQNQNLKKLFLIEAQITNINISNNLALETLYLYETNQLNSIDISNNVNLKDLRIGYFNLTQIDLTNNINLEKLVITHTQINQLNITQNIALKNIYLINILINNLDVTQNSSLEEFQIWSTPINSINVTQNLALKKINFSYTLIQVIDVSNNLFLEQLFCANNLLTSLVLNNNSLLDKFGCTNLNSTGSNNNNINTLIIQNSANSLLNGTYDITEGSSSPVYVNRFDSTNNSSLNCIFVDAVTNCNINWLGKDATSNYVGTQQECENLQNEEFITNSFSIYPNPVNDILYIENTNNNVIKKVTIYNLLGKIVTEQNGNDSQLNFTNIARGLYLLKIETEKETIVKKIIKK